jgi:hypothetical protein
MSLETSRVFFRDQLAKLHAGLERLAELDQEALPARIARPALASVRELASQTVGRTVGRDRELFKRAIAGEKLRAWERRRVEYLAGADVTDGRVKRLLHSSAGYV